MTEAIPDLKHPPIVEAVLDIDCDLPPNIELQQLKDAAREEVRADYPKSRTVFMQQHHIRTNPTATPTHSSTQNIHAFQFTTEDGSQIVQFRQNGFSFNRLKPYSSLDDYLPAIAKAWGAFLKIARPVRLRAIRLRYINRIVLPVSEARVDLQEYVNYEPCLPGDDVTLTGFLTKTSAIDNVTKNELTVILTDQPHEKGGIPLILDISVVKKPSGEMQSWEWIQFQIQELRSLKNQLFRHTLTEKCLSLFQQP